MFLVNKSFSQKFARRFPDGFTQEELTRYFMRNESFSLELDEVRRYEPLIYIKNILKENDVRIMSTNGFSNISIYINR